MSDSQGQEPKTEGQPVETMPVSEEPTVEAPVPSPEASTAEEGDLPQDVSDRTRAEFEKLKTHNKLLAEKLKAFESPLPPRPRSVLEELTPMDEPDMPTPVQEETDPALPIDAEGYLDVGALTKTLKDIEKKADARASKAEQRVARFEQSQETIATHAAHPELDPYSEKYDPDFSHWVKLELVNQMMNGEKNYMKAAQAVKQRFEKIKPQPAPPVIPQVNETVTKRDQINATTGGSKTQITDAEQQQLVQGTLAGNRNAIYQRLKASGY